MALKDDACHPKWPPSIFADSPDPANLANQREVRLGLQLPTLPPFTRAGGYDDVSLDNLPKTNRWNQVT